MGHYIVRRLMFMIPSLWLMVTAVFFLLHVIPGDITDTVFLDASPNPEQKERLRHDLGLDQPVYVQYAQWLGKLLRFDFGYSLDRNKPVLASLKETMPNSLRIGALALVISWIVAIPIGVLAAVRQDSWVDFIARGWAVLMLAIPNFFIAVLTLIVPAFVFGWAPAVNPPPFSEDPIKSTLGSLVPAAVLGVALTGTLLRMTRAMMLEVLRSDYIRTARAKGLAEMGVIMHHALKNALIPVVTILGGQVALLIGGSVIIENLFGIQGMGNLVYQAVLAKDVAVVQAISVIYGVFILAVNLLVDVSYAWLDPRIKFS